jgi:hypothetical protein
MGSGESGGRGDGPIYLYRVLWAAAATGGVLAAQKSLPWLAAYALHYLALTALLKGVLFVWVRHAVRRRRHHSAA